MGLKVEKIASIKKTVKERHLIFLESHFIKWLNYWTNQTIIEDLSDSYIPDMRLSQEFLVTMDSTPILVMKCNPEFLEKHLLNQTLSVGDDFTASLVDDLLADLIARLRPDNAGRLTISKISAYYNKKPYATFYVSLGELDLDIHFFNEVYGWYIQSLNSAEANSPIDLTTMREQNVESFDSKFNC